MRIKKFRIKNYKSIIDSGDCWVDDILTIFAGKNESGKTTILEALHDFNLSKQISEEVIPQQDPNLKPHISITFEISATQLNEYYKKIKIEKKASASANVTITKTYPNVYSSTDEDSLKTFFIDNSILGLKSLNEKIYSLYEEIKLVHFKYITGSTTLFPADSNVAKYISGLQAYKAKMSGDSTNLIAKITDSSLQTKYLNNINELEKQLKSKEDAVKIWNERWVAIYSFIPNFIIFRSFEDAIPNEIALEDLEENELISDLEQISDLDKEIILSDNHRRKHSHKDEINITINEEYAKYWSQDQTTLKIEWDSEKLFIWIIEDKSLFAPTQRSKGKQWHLAFYIRISARALETNDNIILIDEPGLFLHASAQRDIYKRLMDLGQKSQILFTTHSPYLIEQKELQRVRLVTKSKSEGSIILNKIHAKADKETLTPILTAIGLELNQGIANFNKQNNIIVEGPADVFYLNAFSKIIKDSSINFIFGGGAGNMGIIGSILSGWGCKLVYLYDNDQGKNDGIKNLEKVWQVSKELIFEIMNEKGAIEDLFTKEDFTKYVLEEVSLTYTQSNSSYIKSKGVNKVLLSKKFLSLTESKNIKLSKLTEARIKELFVKLKQAF